MTPPDRLNFFFGNLNGLLSRAGITKAQLSREIGASEHFVGEMMAARTSPDLETVYAIAGALKVDVADLLRPGPSFAVMADDRDNRWVERDAEMKLSAELAQARVNTDEPPSFDAVLSWWHSNGRLMTGVDSFSRYIELFEPPDANELMPRPLQIGAESLAAKELGKNDPDLFRQVFEKMEPKIAQRVARAHLEASGDQPRLSVHTISFAVSEGDMVELSYARLLLPVKDGSGHEYIMNYSKPIRRSEVGREEVEHLEPVHGGKPIVTRLV